MSRSGNDLKIFKPQMHSSVGAWFTYKNDQLNEGAIIPGLNLGSNTPQEAGVVEQNKEMLFKEIGVSSEWFADARQVHGTKVQVVTQGGTYTETDALVTQIQGLALGIQVADCAAVLMADFQQKVVAAVHAGWRGAAGGIVKNVIKKMRSLGAEPERIKAFISPCISLSKFEVGYEVAELFADNYVDYKSYDKPHIDLKGLLIKGLTESGVTGPNIEVHAGCTVSDTGNFYSYRREAEASGRMMGIIKIKE